MPSVTALDHIFSDHIFSDHIFSENIFSDYYSDDFQEVFYDVLLSGRLTCLKMDLPELSPRMFTVGEEPAAIRSISYHSDDTKLFKALCDCLTADEYEDLKASKLGVFIKFKELGFGWTSRLVHFILCFQLDIKKKFELWSLVVSQPVRFSLIEFEHLTGLNCDYIKDLENPRCEVTKEMAAFWEKMSVDLDTGPILILLFPSICKSVTALDHIFSDHIFSDNIFSDCLKMDLPELPLRMFTLGEEPAAIRSIRVEVGSVHQVQGAWLWLDFKADTFYSLFPAGHQSKKLLVSKQKNRSHFYEYSSSKSSEMLEVVWTIFLSEITFAKLRRRSVTAWDHIFSDHIFSDNIFSDCLKMDLPELPPRMFTLGEEPAAIRSILYHSDDTKLFKALCDCLTADEYEDLKASKLEVFIKFKELGFGWTSRLVHFILCFQLDIKKKFELWSLVVSQPVRFSLIEFEHLTGLNCDYIKDLENPRCEVTKEMAAFWEKMGVDLDTGPNLKSRLPNSAAGISVTAWDHIFSENIFSDSDEYEDLKASKLGVFIKFKGLGFGWTSKLVHFILCFQLDIKKKFELWSLVVSQPMRFSLIEFEHLTGLNCDYIEDLENPRCEVTKEMTAFWEKMGVDLDTGPRKKFSTATPASLARLVMDLEKFENYPWGRVTFKVLMDSLKAKDLTQTGYTVDGFIQVLQVWAYYAMPELDANYGSPINVNNFVQKDLDEMFPEWDGDVEDSAADNIIKVMFNDHGWKWTMDCWQVTSTNKVVKMEVSPVKTEVSPVKLESVVKEESSRPSRRRWRWIYFKSFLCAMNGKTKTMMRTWEQFEHLTGLNCDYIKDLENPRCEVTKEMAAFWEKMSVDLDTGPRKKFSTSTRASLARLVMDLEKFENYPWGRVAFKVLMDSLKAKDLTQTDRFHCCWLTRVAKDDTDVLSRLSTDSHRYSEGCEDGSESSEDGSDYSKSESVVKEESSRPRKKARKGSSVSAEAPAPGSDGFWMTKEQVERAFKDIYDAISDGFGTCLREIKLLGDRMGAVEKKVGITKKESSSNDLQLTTTSNPPKHVHEPGVSTKTSPKITEKRVTRQSVRKSQN
ncbi:hypothetical protein DY000_02025074 [Brassica cretica]|uniref:DUF1985 domain-containing protein n=1 Tax=Brassica cretica TaxID=69181 RepID=A0ABQ7E7K0_BRACR|nr:hypothetical protein DY000_02025074 [Brassica cretica]